MAETRRKTSVLFVDSRFINDSDEFGKMFVARIGTCLSKKLIKCNCRVTVFLVQTLNPEINVNYASTTAVQCVHGDVKRYPWAEVLVGVQDQVYMLNVAVVDNLPADMILGRDMPVLTDLLIADVNVDHDVNPNVETDVNVTTYGTEQSFPAVTRAQAKAGVHPLPDLDSSLLQGGTKGPRKTRRQAPHKVHGYSSP